MKPKARKFYHTPSLKVEGKLSSLTQQIGSVPVTAPPTTVAP